MTAERNVEHVLQRWLVDGVDEMPDRVYLSILDRVERQPQQRAWRVSWRDSHVSTYLKYAAAVAAVVAVAGVFLLIRPGEPTVGGPSISPPPSASPAADDGWWRTEPDCGTCRGGLQVGSYTTTAFEPPLTYTVPIGWVNNYDGPDGVALLPDTPGNRSHVATETATLHDLTVVRDVDVEANDCSRSVDPQPASAADIVDSIVGRPGLDTSDPKPVTIGGLAGLQLDASLATDWTTPCREGDETPSAALFAFSNGSDYQAASPGERYRLIFLDVPATAGGGVMLIDVFAQDGDLADHANAATPIIESFEFELTPAASPS